MGDAMGTTGTADPRDLRHMAEAWGEDIFPAPPEDQRAKDAAAADVLRRAAVPHLLACADEIERLRAVAEAAQRISFPSNTIAEFTVDGFVGAQLKAALDRLPRP